MAVPPLWARPRAAGGRRRGLPRCARVPPGPPRVALYLHEDLILLIEGLPVLPVVERGNPHDLLLLIDDGHGEDVLDDPARVVQGPFLQGEASGCPPRCLQPGPSPSGHERCPLSPGGGEVSGFLWTWHPPPPPRGQELWVWGFAPGPLPRAPAEATCPAGGSGAWVSRSRRLPGSEGSSPVGPLPLTLSVLGSGALPTLCRPHEWCSCSRLAAPEPWPVAGEVLETKASGAAPLTRALPRGVGPTGGPLQPGRAPTAATAPTRTAGHAGRLGPGGLEVVSSGANAASVQPCGTTASSCPARRAFCKEGDVPGT